jgi:hypothetical protein
MVTLLKVCLCAICFMHVGNSVHKITNYSSWSENLVFVIFRKKLAQKSSVFIELLRSNIVVPIITLLKVYLCTMCFIYSWNYMYKITKYSDWSEILLFTVFHKKITQRTIVFVRLKYTHELYLLSFSTTWVYRFNH